MNKSASSLPAAVLFGGIGACLLAIHASSVAQPPLSPPESPGVAPSIVRVANPEPAAAKVEEPAGESKPDEAAAPTTDTEILASQGATFAAKDRIAVFTGDVRVKDPRFTLACDKLTVYLATGAVPAASSTPPPVETPAKTGEDKPGQANRNSGIDRAVAEGHVIIIQKHPPARPGEEEKTSIGRSDIAEFDNKTGDMTLRGLPRVEQNGNSHEALSRSTWMVLHQNNNLDTHGPNRTRIVQHDKDSLPGASPGTKGGTPPPAASPPVRRPPTSGT